MKKRFLSFLAITMMIATTIQAQIPTNGLVAYYPFSGNANDSSGNGNNGTVNCATLTTDRFGKANSAYSLTAINQKIDLMTSDSWLGANNFSFSFWFYTGVSTIDQTIISKRPSCLGGGEQFFELGKSANTDTISFWTNGFYNFQVPFIPNSWNHFVYTKTSATNSVIYINNVPYNITHPAFSITGTHPMGISSSSYCLSNYYPSHFFEGKIDDVRLYNRSLNNTEIQALFNESISSTPIYYSQQWLKVIDSTSTVNNTFSELASSSGFSDLNAENLSRGGGVQFDLSLEDTAVALIGTQQNSSSDIYLASLNTINGNLKWQYTYNNSGTDGGSNLVYAGGFLYATGIINQSKPTQSILMQFQPSNGAYGVFNPKIFNTGGYNASPVVIASEKTSYNILFKRFFLQSTSMGQNQYPTQQYYSKGYLNWTDTMATNDWYYGYAGAITIDNNDNVITTGKYATSITNPNTYQIAIHKLSSVGTTLWSSNYVNPNGGATYVSNNIITDMNNDIIFGTAGANTRLVKLSGVNASILKDTLISSSSMGVRVITNTNGNILLNTGNTQNGLIALDGTTFSTLWTKPLSSTSRYTLSVDNKSNIYVSDGSSIKVYSATGKLLDSINISVSGYTVAPGGIKIDTINNCFYVYGNIYTSTITKMFVAKYTIKGSNLPLEISEISAIKNAGAVNINWKTATEINTANFLIQHGTDGNSYTDIGDLNAKGSGANSYSFTDNCPLNGINYYRLQSIDKDGSSSYSKVVSVNFGDNQSFSISPNPAKDFATISFSKTIDKAKIAVYDITGKQVIIKSLSGNLISYRLNTQSLKSGLYVIKVNTATGNYNEKLLINK